VPLLTALQQSFMEPEKMYIYSNLKQILETKETRIKKVRTYLDSATKNKASIQYSWIKDSKEGPIARVFNLANALAHLKQVATENKVYSKLCDDIKVIEKKCAFTERGIIDKSSHQQAQESCISETNSFEKEVESSKKNMADKDYEIKYLHELINKLADKIHSVETAIAQDAQKIREEALQEAKKKLQASKDSEALQAAAYHHQVQKNILRKKTRRKSRRILFISIISVVAYKALVMFEAIK